MTGIASVGSVGAGLSGAQFRAQYQVQALKQQQQVSQDLGTAALQLIRTALAAPQAPAHDLDVLA